MYPGYTKSVLLYCNTFTAILTIAHGRVTSAGVHVTSVEGVAVLNLGGTASISHFFDCHTSQGSPSNLRWTMEEGTQRFPTQVFGPFQFNGEARTVLRMDLAPPSRPVGHADTGTYICTDIASNPIQSVSINITGGEPVFTYLVPAS